ncbi:hypothetical protein [Streptomyces olivaceus]|uniref:hypothetical protein n=1 Tax=Streptomyces olivaceus TaxID=47716 RepID=UPI003669AA37
MASPRRPPRRRRTGPLHGVPRVTDLTGVALRTVDLSEHTRLLGEVYVTLKELRAEAARIQKSEIDKPVREIAPLSLRVQELAMQCTRQVHDLSVSQYPQTEDDAEDLAHLVGACAQISLAATLCNLAIHHRTEIYLYEDADPTPATSIDQLRRAGKEMQRASTTYRAVAQRLSRRLASFTTRAEGPQHGPPQTNAKPMTPPARRR